MSNKLYILFSGIFILVSMVGIYLVTSEWQENKVVDRAEVKSSSLTKVKKISKNKEVNVNNSSLSSDNSLTILNMWYDLAADEKTEGVRLNDNVSKSRKVGIHTDLLAAIKPGYRVQLPNLVGEGYFLKLDRVERVTNEEIQIYGEIEDQDEVYFSTISIIGNTLLAVLSTPEGDYDLNMIDGKGVVYKSEDVPSSKASSVTDMESFLK